MKYESHLKTADRTFLSLCAQIDNLKEELAYWKEMYEIEKAENAKQLNERLYESKLGAVNALKFAFAVQDGEDGSLVISKETRKELAESWNKS